MKWSFTLIIILCSSIISVGVLGQKKIIDIESCKEWERLEEIEGKASLISADGNFLMYKTYSKNKGSMTIFNNLKMGAETRFFNTYNEKSFANGWMFSFQFKDSLLLFDLQKGRNIYFPRVKNYFVIDGDYIKGVGYFTGEGESITLTIWDHNRGQILEIPHVDMSQFWLNDHGKFILIKTNNSLICTDLNSLNQKVLGSNKTIGNLVFSKSGNEVAYISEGVNGNELSYFDLINEKKFVLLDDSSAFLKSKWKLKANFLSFSNNDSNIFFKISTINGRNSGELKSAITRDMDLWSYKDLYLQEKQLYELQSNSELAAMIKVQSKKALQIESNDISLRSSLNSSNYVVLISDVNEDEFYWNGKMKQVFLFSTMTGCKKLITEAKFPGISVIGLSPDDRFLVWFDGIDGNYYSYNIEKGKTLNVSKFDNGFLSYLNQKGEALKAGACTSPYSGQFWVDDGQALIVHARNDIWKLDLSGIKAPINLTNGIGEAKNFRFRVIDEGNSPLYMSRERLLIWAFDFHLKKNGFWEISLDNSFHPTQLMMTDDVYYFVPQSSIILPNSAEDVTRFKPVKALEKNAFVIRKMNSSNTANLFYTTDFKNFKQISNVHPNENYNWSNTKLISYTLPNGQNAEGILHLPNNLDTTKKYPIIFNYYERRSELLNVFRTPELSGHNINIQWFVSRGYLIFEPDFYYKRGETAQSVIDAITAAINSLSKISYIDTSRMGIQGQSFGGYETNVLATQTKYFKAACEMAGPTDIISEFGSIRPGGSSNQFSADRGQRNLGVFPWEKPNIFIKNSPLFHINNAVTPLLMVHNKDDGAILYSQAIELYLGLRRLNKTVWLLQYDHEGHTIENENNKIDFTIRMQQFFDHYLKWGPAPLWMTHGIAAKDKGIISAIDLDPKGDCNDECIICKKWKGKWKNDSIGVKWEIKQWENNYPQVN